MIYFWIGLGSALGGMARYWCTDVIARLAGETFPWGTVAVNVSGCALIGLFATLTGPQGRLPAEARPYPGETLRGKRDPAGSDPRRYRSDAKGTGSVPRQPYHGTGPHQGLCRREEIERQRPRTRWFRRHGAAVRKGPG